MNSVATLANGGYDASYIAVKPSDGSIIGAGEDLQRVVSYIHFVLLDHYAVPVSRRTLEDDFMALAMKWQRETTYHSSVADIATHPAYQRIIGMGPSVIPLILGRLEIEDEPAHWFWALKYTSGVDPVPSTDRGDLEKMRRAWLDWGERQGYLASRQPISQT